MTNSVSYAGSDRGSERGSDRGSDRGSVNYSDRGSVRSDRGSIDGQSRNSSRRSSRSGYSIASETIKGNSTLLHLEKRFFTKTFKIFDVVYLSIYD